MHAPPPTPRPFARPAWAAATALLALAAAVPAQAQRPNALRVALTQSGISLEQPKMICSDPSSHTLNTRMEIRSMAWVLDSTRARWRLYDPARDSGLPDTAVHHLRTFGSPRLRNPADCTSQDTTQLEWTVPAPTFQLHVGDTYNMNLTNALDAAPYPTKPDGCNHTSSTGAPVSDVMPNCFHGNNVTNFHYHGFHVSPNPPQDFIFLELYPVGTVAGGGANPDSVVGTYSFHVGPLPGNQAPGTDWYHPHKHGATALQVVNGAAGTFEILGAFDDSLAAMIPGLTERVIVLQEIRDSLNFAGGGNAGTLYVNGQVNPVIDMQPGEVQRWRIVNATQQQSSNVTVGFETLSGSPTIRPIAFDGVQFATATYDSASGKLLRIAPGNRVDVLVKAGAGSGTFHLERVRNIRLAPLAEQELRPQAQPLRAGARLQALAGRATALTSVQAAGGAQSLLTVRVSGAPMNMQLPAAMPQMPGFLSDVTSIDTTRTLVFTRTGNIGSAPSFTIDSAKFQPGKVNQTMKLNAAEEWKLVNQDDAINHPIHIHINPFQLVEVFAPNPKDAFYNPNGKGDTAPRVLVRPWKWMDTVALPLANGSTPGYVKIRQRFEDFTGKYVLHCHVLGHEDRGMMQELEVVPVR